MKPCKDKKRLIVWSAASAIVEKAQQRQLAEHLKCCPGCRDYFEQMLALKEDLTETFETSNLEPSASLHQRVTQRVLRQSRAASVISIVSTLSSWRKIWRGILAGTFALAIMGLFFAFKTAPEIKHPSDRPVAKVPKQKELHLPGTSFAEYHQITGRSLDALDNTLTKQGNIFAQFKRYRVSSGATFALEN